jgi:hypothetical protein
MLGGEQLLPLRLGLDDFRDGRSLRVDGCGLTQRHGATKHTQRTSEEIAAVHGVLHLFRYALGRSRRPLPYGAPPVQPDETTRYRRGRASTTCPPGFGVPAVSCYFADARRHADRLGVGLPVTYRQIVLTNASQAAIGEPCLTGVFATSTTHPGPRQAERCGGAEEESLLLVAHRAE